MTQTRAAANTKMTDMDAWLNAHQPWLKGPGGYVLMVAVALMPMVFVAYRRRAGFDTYWRMPLHIFGIALIVVVLRMLGQLIGLPSEKQNGSLNFLFVPVVAFL